MSTLFEKSDYLNSPVEAFTLNSTYKYFPVTSHWHYFCEILYIVNGEGSVMCNDLTYSIKKGDFVLFPPQAVHAIYSDSFLELHAMKFDMGLLKSSGSHITGFNQIFNNNLDITKVSIILNDNLFPDLNLKEMFETCIREVREKAYGYDLCVNSELTTLLTHILRIWRKNGFDTDLSLNHTETTDSLSTIVEYIDANLGQPIKVEELAEKCNMSYSYFAKKFNMLYGRSCKEYIESMRISKVKDLLLFTDLDLNFISQETGFADCSHLIRTFKKFENTTPKQYRIKNK